MNVEFNLEKIKALMVDFYNVTHIQVRVCKSDFSVQLAYPENCNKVCAWIRTTKEGFMRCDKSGAAGLEACKAGGNRIHIWRCHAGFLECGIPVYVRNEMAGYIIFGQFIDGSENERETIFLRCADILDDKAKLAKLLDGLSIFNMDFIESAAHLMAACLHSVLLEDACRIRDDPIWMRIDRYIDDHLRQPLRLETIAEENSVSPSTVSHKVKKATGKSVGEVILNRRMVLARRYLMQPGIRISEVAQLVGIPDYNYFSRVFRKTYGYSPNQFRNYILPNQNMYAGNSSLQA